MRLIQMIVSFQDDTQYGMAPKRGRQRILSEQGTPECLTKGARERNGRSSIRFSSNKADGRARGMACSTIADVICCDGGCEDSSSGDPGKPEKEAVRAGMV